MVSVELEEVALGRSSSSRRRPGLIAPLRGMPRTPGTPTGARHPVHSSTRSCRHTSAVVAGAVAVALAESLPDSR